MINNNKIIFTPTTIKEKTELKAIFDDRQSFYKKAFIYEDDEFYYLKSYDSFVAKIRKINATNEIYNKIYIKCLSSNTTTRHIKEFVQQYAKKYIDIKNLQALELLNLSNNEYVINKKLYNIYKKKGVLKMKESKNWTTDAVSYIYIDQDHNYNLVSNTGHSGFCIEYFQRLQILTKTEIKEIDPKLFNQVVNNKLD